jgi:hypothetical protein
MLANTTNPLSHHNFDGKNKEFPYLLFLGIKKIRIFFESLTKNAHYAHAQWTKYSN